MTAGERILAEIGKGVVQTPVNIDRGERNKSDYCWRDATAPTVTVTMRPGCSLRPKAALICAAVTRSTCRVQVSR